MHSTIMLINFFERFRAEHILEEVKEFIDRTLTTATIFRIQAHVWIFLCWIY